MQRTYTEDYQQIFLTDVPLIDTRAPVEYEKGAFNNAVNLPLMSDQERHLVGIRYKQAGQDAAIELGRELVNTDLQKQRTEAWVSFARNNPEGYLYCFRGGLRSRITQDWMADAGVHYPYIKGGYKAMRRFLIDRFADDVAKTGFVLISGRTGTGKTLLLNRIKRSLDLEGMANHRGSSFGPMETPQPTPISFENSLAVRMLKHSRNKTAERVFVEGEGRQVGSLSLPQSLWQTMCESPTLVLEAGIERRVEIGMQDYVVDLLARIQKHLPGDAGLKRFTDRHRTSLHNIRKRLGEERYIEACKLLEEAIVAHQESLVTEGYQPFIRFLLEKYYDPMYDYQLSQRTSKVLCRGDQSDLIAWLEHEGVEMFS